MFYVILNVVLILFVNCNCENLINFRVNTDVVIQQVTYCYSCLFHSKSNRCLTTNNLFDIQNWIRFFSLPCGTPSTKVIITLSVFSFSRNNYLNIFTVGICSKWSTVYFVLYYRKSWFSYMYVSSRSH